MIRAPAMSRTPGSDRGVVLVTGGSGFIGSALSRRLIRAGFTVRILDPRRPRIPVSPGGSLTWTRASVLDQQVVLAEVAKANSVVHLAAVHDVSESMADPELYHRVNVAGTVGVLEACRRLERPLVFTSSAAVYGNGDGRPLSPYGQSKRVAESYCLAWRDIFGARCCVLRLFNVYGPGQSPRGPTGPVVPSFMAAAVAGARLRLQGDGLQVRHFVFVDVVCQAILVCIRRVLDLPRPVDLGLGESVNLLELVDALGALLGRRLATAFDEPRSGDVSADVRPDGWLPPELRAIDGVPLDQGLRRTLRWSRRELANNARAE